MGAAVPAFAAVRSSGVKVQQMTIADRVDSRVKDSCSTQPTAQVMDIRA
jgi:hypothetical protein